MDLFPVLLVILIPIFPFVEHLSLCLKYPNKLALSCLFYPLTSGSVSSAAWAITKCLKLIQSNSFMMVWSNWDNRAFLPEHLIRFWDVKFHICSFSIWQTPPADEEWWLKALWRLLIDLLVTFCQTWVLFFKEHKAKRSLTAQCKQTKTQAKGKSLI